MRSAVLLGFALLGSVLGDLGCGASTSDAVDDTGQDTADVSWNSPTCRAPDSNQAGCNCVSRQMCAQGWSNNDDAYCPPAVLIGNDCEAGSVCCPAPPPSPGPHSITYSPYCAHLRSNDDSNCGRCGHQCAEGTRCVTGSCQQCPTKTSTDPSSITTSWPNMTYDVPDCCSRTAYAGLCVAEGCSPAGEVVKSADQCCAGNGVANGLHDSNLYCNPTPTCTHSGTPATWSGGSDCCGGAVDQNGICTSRY
jgi:hypothetical protein